MTGRRKFLKEALVTGTAAVLAKPGASAAQSATDKAPDVERPHPALIAAETQAPSLMEAPAADAAHIGNPGSDLMVDLLRIAGIDYVAAMPGSTFRGIHESIVNYAGDVHPQLIVCTHEEASAAIAHGYAKVAGKPMACLVHSTVGLQHASMAIYNAWCDRVPMMVLAGNIADATKRRPGVEWYHTAQDLGALVRDYTKWDDYPMSLQHYAESFMRAYTMSVTPPMEPVLIVADTELQEQPIADPRDIRVPPLRVATPPVASGDALATAAAMLCGAKTPVIVADRAVRTQAAMDTLVRIAESLNAPVVDQLGRMNFPTGHYLNHTSRQAKLLAQADVILALEVGDVWGLTGTVPDTIERPSKPRGHGDARVVSISTAYLYGKSNMQDSERYSAPALAIAGDAEASLPGLLHAVLAAITPAQREIVAAREQPMKLAFAEMRNNAREAATRAWDASPISTARLCQEVWNVIRHEDWAMVSPPNPISMWPLRLWDFTKTYQFIGSGGGYGVGYGAPAAVGAALAHRDAGRIAVNIQTDGDLMVLPGALWTAAHHALPLLTVMHNNRAWHQETMHIQRMASRRDRHPERGTMGTLLQDPPIDFAALAKSMGMWAEGPVSEPGELGPALARAMSQVKSGKPALVDVLTQPR
ncbi:acetolactate synthase-1/2/3 large subunit [Paraburkholderia fungorum]|uniref:Acetolactate synthase-1/2/3 large subunit n=1 Tax=Paraburkholderia fungorum TaxID=134537 RepID=A0A1H1JG96_9BURK|nr:thiamine pyrophosphate-dependent enzyme [Paraburkholderia fungorum]SDR48954.1 acetolactate synthase-1/2/3 large subunit [Paraburkholderia fungorum]